MRVNINHILVRLNAKYAHVVNILVQVRHLVQIAIWEHIQMEVRLRARYAVLVNMLTQKVIAHVLIVLLVNILEKVRLLVVNAARVDTSQILDSQVVCIAPLESIHTRARINVYHVRQGIFNPKQAHQNVMYVVQAHMLKELEIHYVLYVQMGVLTASMVKVVVVYVNQVNMHNLGRILACYAVQVNILQKGRIRV